MLKVNRAIVSESCTPPDDDSPADDDFSPNDDSPADDEFSPDHDFPTNLDAVLSQHAARDRASLNDAKRCYELLKAAADRQNQ